MRRFLMAVLVIIVLGFSYVGYTNIDPEVDANREMPQGNEAVLKSLSASKRKGFFSAVIFLEDRSSDLPPTYLQGTGHARNFRGSSRNGVYSSYNNPDGILPPGKTSLLQRPV